MRNSPTIMAALLGGALSSGILAGCTRCATEKPSHTTGAAGESGATQEPVDEAEIPAELGVTPPGEASSPETPAADPAFAAPLEQPAASLIVEDLRVGTGPEATEGRRASLIYKGTLPDGAPFDSWQDRAKPFQFTVGSGVTIEGFDQGVRGMREGGIRRIVIPPHLAYGDRSFGDSVPPKATLQFEIELLKVE